MMKIIPHGAAREVTGTCHELQVNGKSILLDCGLFQGHRREATEKNSSFTFDPKKGIDAMILTHAHMDHVGRVPLLWKRGYRGPIHCTYATKDLAAVMMQDGAFIQEKDEEYFRKHCPDSMVQSDGPLYTQEDAKECVSLFHGVSYNEWFPVIEGVRAKFIDAGHIIGAAMVIFEIAEKSPDGKKTRRLGFSGDLGRANLPIIREPAPMPPVEVLLCESTYGNRRHESIDLAQGQLRDVIHRTAKRGGKVIIPAFSLERTQEIVYDLHVLWDKKEIPGIPIVIDSPLATRVTDVFMRHPECYNEAIYKEFFARQHNPFQFSLVRYTESVDESKALNAVAGPMIIMAGSGMCEAGRIRHHLKNYIEDQRNTVLAVGYMAGNTLGAKIVDPAVKAVKIFDQTYKKNAEIVYIDAYSGHADMIDLDRYLASIEGLEKVILVHGDVEQMDPFAQRISKGLGIEVLTPKRDEEIVV